MKITHVSETIHGGIATYLNEVVPEQLNLGIHEVSLLIPDNQIDCLKFSTDFITFKREERGLMSLFSFLVNYRKLLKEKRPDIVHIHSSFAGMIVRLYHLINPIRKPLLVYCAHGWSFSMTTHSLSKFLYSKIEKFLSYFTDEIICISNFEKQLAIQYGLPEKKLSVVYNSISLIKPKSSYINIDIDVKKTNFLFVGRFHEAKGFDFLPEVFSKLGEQYHLYVAGGARLGNEYDIDVPPNVTKMGWLNSEQLQCLYDTVDAVIVPSRWEGFGYVAVEAMRSSKPVLVSNNGALPELIKNEYNGLVFDLTTESIIERIQSLDKLKLNEYGKNGYYFFLNHFESKININKLHNIYNKLINEKV